MLVFVDADWRATRHRIRRIHRYGLAGGWIVQVHHGSAPVASDLVQERRLADGTWAVEGDDRFHLQQSIDDRPQPPRDMGGDLTSHRPKVTKLRLPNY